jgi:hypothetical protein
MRNDVAHLEVEIRRLLDSVSLRPTLDGLVQNGERLQRVKDSLPHGQWLLWLRRMKLQPRTAQLHMQLARERPPPGAIGLHKFLQLIRAAKRRIAKESFAERRAADSRRLPPSYQLVHADCRKYDWPKPIDLIATDPP